MKFSFIAAVVYSSLYFAFAQFGNYEFEVYEQDPNTGAIRPVATNRVRTTTKRYQSNYEVYEYDPHSGSIKPVAVPNRMTTNNYQNNIFLNPSNQNQNVPSQTTPATKTENSATMSLTTSSCEHYWTLKRDYNGVWGQLAIPSPNQQKAEIRIFLTVATALPSVSDLHS